MIGDQTINLAYRIIRAKATVNELTLQKPSGLAAQMARTKLADLRRQARTLFR
ncbi:hypothetical protein QDW38_gp55 [Microbacterium phage Lynlen]|uniref:hypothetical protein n=1 Tax=Microbacterium phage Lynlen TaxID=2725651 RepID=UPI001463CF6B|nr:hypothetical protein QDW38_gp55 [Microbacterium phage Lynlen]YP_010753550.1 hypothetical protein QDW39_gp54 [Microbacterium phage Kenzers]QJD53464.1 hypothetical protein SEA_LYNLEN_55 [Microbacterium phage Lynlen]UVT31683.1 hypothetical protein SEA_KENZERS_54 [Microbacterium phage Kenzers]